MRVSLTLTHVVRHSSIRYLTLPGRQVLLSIYAHTVEATFELLTVQSLHVLLLVLKINLVVQISHYIFLNQSFVIQLQF